MQRESINIEYKERISKSYLKTVSAYANYNTGEIIFGINDDLKVIGIENPIDACLDIENQINDSIKPQPVYTLRINNDNTITLDVQKGEHTPYLYNGKAYRRNDSSTIEVDDVELKDLILKGENLTFEGLKSKNQDLSFSYLSNICKKNLGLNEFNLDTLKTLYLFKDNFGYNNAAALLSDSNEFPGVDIMVFGDDINQIKNRFNLAGKSILEQYYEALKIYENEYVFEQIEYGLRKRKEKIPNAAYREALANAIVQRRWDIKANIKVEMYKDEIIIHSPGGLETGISVENYLQGAHSLLRNEIIGSVFFRLGIIEKFATGIKRINASYSEFLTKPSFNVDYSSITIRLPITVGIDLSENERILLSVMNPNFKYSRNDLESETGLSKYMILRILNSLLDKNIIAKNGTNPNILYSRIK